MVLWLSAWAQSITRSGPKSTVEVILWPHYSSSPNESSVGSEPDSLVESVGAPSLVAALALLQLKSLQEGASLGSLASEAAATAVGDSEELDVVVDGKPLRIQMSDWLSPSPTLSARRPPKTLSSPGFAQVRNPNGTFGPNQEVSQ